MPSKVKIVGIYKITCAATGDFYIGSSVNDIKTRWRRHKSDLVHNKHPNQKMQNFWNKYKTESFTFEVIKTCAREECITNEQHYIDTLKPTLNLCSVAGNTMGRPASEKQKEAVRKASLGNKHNLGKKWSEERLMARILPIYKEKEVQVFDLRSKVTFVFKNILSAEKYTGSNRYNIVQNIKSECKPHGDYIWAFTEVVCQK